MGGRARGIYPQPAGGFKGLSGGGNAPVRGNKTNGGVVRAGPGDVADRRSLHHGPARCGPCHSPARRETRHPHALRLVSLLDRYGRRIAQRNEENQRAENSRAEAGGETMIRSENLQSGYIQDDVEEYLYRLLPERDSVVREMEDYAEQNRVPIIGPAVGRMLALFVQVSGAKRIFEMGSAIGYSTIWLARAAGAEGKVLYSDGDPEKARRAKG